MNETRVPTNNSDRSDGSTLTKRKHRKRRAVVSGDGNWLGCTCGADLGVFYRLRDEWRAWRAHR